jgi:uncharacterized protein (TIGR00730 family)
MQKDKKNAKETRSDLMAPLTRADKAYDNKSFLHSDDGRVLRIMAEYLHPKQHLEEKHIDKAIIFFGSARTLSKERYEDKLRHLNSKLGVNEESQKPQIQKEIARLERLRETTSYYEDTLETSRLLTEWCLTLPLKKQFYVCSGGGPGIMEAANRGAFLAGGKSLGLNISLPFEQNPNQYITPELNFEFHYFFMRKFWFVTLASAMIVCPGGFGTMDEMMEIMTLLQTKKTTKPLPIVLYNEKFWKTLFNFDFLVETGMINKEDLNLFTYANTPQEAFEYIKAELTRIHKL